MFGVFLPIIINEESEFRYSFRGISLLPLSEVLGGFVPEREMEPNLPIADFAFTRQSQIFHLRWFSTSRHLRA